MLLSLTYVSSATALLDAPALVRMLETIRPRNEARDVSGLLLYRGGNVLQVLEGPEKQVEATFAAIETDPRHHGVIVLLRESVEERAFPGWSMGFRDATDMDLEALEGFSDFLRDGDTRTAGDGPHAQTVDVLLRVFRDTMR